jgi:hypothetical protein
MEGRLVSTFLSLVGGLVGGVIGYFAFRGLVGQGFYALMLPGAFLGLGCNLLARHRSVIRGVICGVAALPLGLFAEWKEFPFAADGGFTFMVTHFHEKVPIKIIMLILGVVLAFWFGRDGGYLGRTEKSRGDRPSSCS